MSVTARKKTTKKKKDVTGTNKQKGTKLCSCCHKEKDIVSGFYISYSPLFSIDKRVPICKTCIINNSLNEDGTINEIELNKILRQIDRPYYKDLIESSVKNFKKEHSYIDDEEVKYHGRDILKTYFRLIAMRQDRAKSYSDSEKENFVHTSTNRSKAELDSIKNKYSSLMSDATSSNTYYQTPSPSTNTIVNQKDRLVYSDIWMGEYTQQDLDRLDQYYESLNSDYKIVTVNHRDYARKIAKASLMMDKAYEDMLKGVPNAEKMYTNAKDIFDSLSKSAKFSEDKRSINDVGISSFSKIVSMVENHNWIPQHAPEDKDMYDKMLSALSVINKSI